MPTCPVCRGSCYIYKNIEVTCTTCMGKGCAFCHYTGRRMDARNVRCEHCNGMGETPENGTVTEEEQVSIEGPDKWAIFFWVIVALLIYFFGC